MYNPQYQPQPNEQGYAEQQQVQHQQNPPVVYVQALPNAVPVAPTPVMVYAPSQTPVMVYAPSQPPPVYAVPVQQNIPVRVIETNDVGICRRCRQAFRRPPGVNDGQANYYRCAQCNDKRGEEMLDSLCVIA